MRIVNTDTEIVYHNARAFSSVFFLFENLSLPFVDFLYCERYNTLMRMKKWLIAFMITVYLMQISLLVGMGIFFALPDAKIYFVFIAPAVFLCLAFVLGCINIVFGVLQFKSPEPNVTKTVMLAKLSLIPFFIVNFILCILLIAGLLNPFLFMSIFIVAPLLIAITYGITFVTSSYNLGFIVNKFINGESNITTLVVCGVFHFFFVFDVIGSILLYKSTKI